MCDRKAFGNRSARALLGLCGLGLLPAATVVAQQAASNEFQLEEIIVTARQRAETLNDVPASVAVFTTAQIDAHDISRARDFISLTPGVSIVNAAEVADSQVNIRGINGTRDSEPNYALVIDGIVLTNPAALNREYTNLKQIEVLKGPQGAIYGRNATAGAFIITTEEPGQEWGGKLKATMAENTTWNTAGNIGGAVSDTLRIGLGGSARSTDGYYNNEYASQSGNDTDIVDNFKDWNLSARAIWQPTEALKVDSKFRYGKVDAASIMFNSTFQLPGFTGFLGPAAYENINIHDFLFVNNINPSNDQDSTEFSVKADYDLGWADLTTWGLYSDINNDLTADGASADFRFFFPTQQCIDSTAALTGSPMSPPTGIGPTPQTSLYGAYSPTTCDGTQYQQRNQKDYSFEVRLTSKSDQRLRWLGGLYYLNLKRDVTVNTGVDVGTGAVRSRYIETQFDVNGQPTNNGTQALSSDEFRTDAYAVFGQLAYDLTPTIETSLALRYDLEVRDAKSLVPTDATTIYIDTCADGLTGDTDGLPDPVNPGLCFGNTLSKESKNFSALEPKFAITWDATENITAYSSIGAGFKSGGFNNQGSAATINLGINALIYGTGDANDSTTWNGFFGPNSNTNPDASVSSPAICAGQNNGPNAGTGFCPVLIQDNYDKETSWAFEAGIKTDWLDRRLHAEAAVYYTKVDDMQFFEFYVGPFGLLRVVSNIDKVELSGIEAATSYVATDWLNLYAGVNFTQSDIKKNKVRPDTEGNDSPYTPAWTGNLGAQVTFPMNADMNFVANIDWRGVGKTWFHVVQGDQQRPTGFSAAFGVPEGGQYDKSERDSYWLMNLRAGVAGADDRWRVVAFIDNLFDENYLEEAIPAPEFGGTFIVPGSQSRIGIEASISF